MKLAPRMIQSMEILQMPLMALQERIEQELESNIALELANLRDDDDDRQRDDDDDDNPNVRERELVAGDETADFERLNEFEKNYGEGSENDYVGSTYSASRHAGQRDGKIDAMANHAARGEGLPEQLLHQIAFMDMRDDVAEAARLLVQYLDDDGFLGMDLESILEEQQLKETEFEHGELSLDLLEEALIELQNSLDPPGIAARDQKECLLLQVDRFAADRDNTHDWKPVITLITHHYDDLLQNRLPKIVQKSDMSMDDIKEAMLLMRHLTLRPGRDLTSEDVPPITPDVIIEYEEATDNYVARLADGIVPLLRISTDAEKLAKDKSQDKQTRDFASNGLRNASWLIDAINQRQNTLLRVVKIVIARQRDYFDYGPQALKPLPMTEVADMLGVHVATVSRAVAEKWLQTPRGVVPLRSFFSGGSTTDDGEDVSWQAVKAMLQEIVDDEDKSKPFSDEALSKELKKRGIEIARRTVVKYRSQLDIPAARFRKVH